MSQKEEEEEDEEVHEGEGNEENWDEGYSEEEDQNDQYDEDSQGEDVGYHSGATSQKPLTESESDLPTPRNRPTKSRSQNTQDQQQEDYEYHSEQEDENGDSDRSFAEPDSEIPIEQKQAIASPQKSAEQILVGMPRGFRISTLGKMLKQGERTFVSSLLPGLNITGISYKDLKLNSYRTNLSLVNPPDYNIFKVNLMGCRNIPVPDGLGITILNRRIRVVLFDSDQQQPYMTNIHTMNAVWNRNTPKIWAFPNKRGVFVSRIDENCFIVRTNITNPRVTLLFELAIVFKRNTDSDISEVSCGCATLNLWKQGKRPPLIEFGAHELIIRGGAPMDREYTPLDPNGGYSAPVFKAATKQNFFQQVLTKVNKWQGPTLSLEVTAITNRDTLNNASYLPYNIIISPSSLELVAHFRDILATEFLVGQVQGSSQNRSDPVLVSFLDILSFPDLQEALKAVFFWRQKGLKSVQRRDMAFMRNIFVKSVLQISPLLHIANIPEEVLGKEAAAQARFQFIEKFIMVKNDTSKILDGNKEIHHQNQHSYKPFSLDEVIFDPLRHN